MLWGNAPNIHEQNYIRYLEEQIAHTRTLTSNLNAQQKLNRARKRLMRTKREVNILEKNVKNTENLIKQSNKIQKANALKRRYEPN